MSTIADIIQQAAQRYQLDPATFARIAQIESANNPNAKNPNSSASGLFQFVTPTWQQYGNGKDPFNALDSADAAARLMRDNIASFKSKLGRDPVGWEVYLMHQQGANGAMKLLADPSVAATSVVGADAIRLNGGTDQMTAGDFANLWQKKFGADAQANGVPVPAGSFPAVVPVAVPEQAPDGVNLGAILASAGAGMKPRQVKVEPQRAEMSGMMRKRLDPVRPL